MQKIVDHIVKLFHKLLIKFGVGEQMRYSLIKYSFNTGWMFAEKVLFMIVAFFVGVYVARYLGPDKYGLLNYAISFVAIFRVVAHLGLDNILIKRLNNNKPQKLQLLGTTFSLKVVATSICFLIVVVITLVSKQEFKLKAIILVIAASMLFESLWVIRSFFTAIVKAKYNAIANTLASLISSILKILLILLEKDLIWFALIYLIESFLAGFCLIYLYQAKYKDLLKWRFNFKISISLFKDSWLLLLSGLSVIIYMRIDQLMIKQMLNEKAVGIYSAAVKISEIWYFVPAIIADSAFPAILKAKTHNTSLYNKTTQQLLNLISLISIIIIVPVFLFSKEIIALLFGNAYIEAAQVLQIHIVSILFVSWGMISGKWLIVESLYRNSLYRTLAGAIINIITNIFFINYYGIIGAAYATLLSYLVAGFLFDIFRKETRVSFFMKLKSLNPFAIIYYK